MSRTSASLLLVVVMFGCAIYFLFEPPPGFSDPWTLRIIFPFLFITSALTMLDNLRTRIHMGQLVGALRSISGRAGIPPAPKVTAEAIEVLISALKTNNATTRETALKQLRRITGADAGETADEWRAWYRENREKYKE